MDGAGERVTVRRVTMIVDGKRVRRVPPELRQRRYNIGPPVERALARVQRDSETGCWLWNGALTTAGYGHLNIGGGRYAMAHVVLYEDRHGPVPDGLELDHLCRVRHCVNPDHVEPVTHLENVRRGLAASTLRTGKCKYGHDHAVHGYTSPKGRRHCLECRRLRRLAGAA